MIFSPLQSPLQALSFERERPSVGDNLAQTSLATQSVDTIDFAVHLQTFPHAKAAPPKGSGTSVPSSMRAVSPSVEGENFESFDVIAETKAPSPDQYAMAPVAEFSDPLRQSFQNSQNGDGVFLQASGSMRQKRAVLSDTVLPHDGAQKGARLETAETIVSSVKEPALLALQLSSSEPLMSVAALSSASDRQPPTPAPSAYKTGPSPKVAMANEVELPSEAPRVQAERSSEAEAVMEFVDSRLVRSAGEPASSAASQSGLSVHAPIVGSSAPAVRPAAAPSGLPSHAHSVVIDQIIDQVAEAREAGRSIRPELSVRSAEFGTVTAQIEASSGDWRATVASRDPGFAPAVQAALTERSVSAPSESGLAHNGSSQRGHDSNNPSGSQQGSAQTLTAFGNAQSGAEQRYGSSTGSAQGSAQPYSGDEGDDGSDSTVSDQTGSRYRRADSVRDGGLFA